MDHALNITGEWTMLGVPSLLDLAGCLCKTVHGAPVEVQLPGEGTPYRRVTLTVEEEDLRFWDTQREIMVRSLKADNSAGAASRVLAPQRVCCLNRRGLESSTCFL